jgi:hypothetical protein
MVFDVIAKTANDRIFPKEVNEIDRNVIFLWLARQQIDAYWPNMQNARQ